MVRRWQRVPKIPKPRYREGFRDLTVYAVNLGERIRVFPFFPDGNLDPEAVDELTQLFQDKDSGAVHPLNPRLIKLIYKLTDHFKARQVNLISGFREAAESGGEGHHNLGQAADIMIPGVPLAVLARRARRLGFVGVGFYPVSGFIHLDIRDNRSFFWVDRSGPGQRGCLRRILSQSALKFDRRWRQGFDEPKRHVNRKGIPLGAVETPVPHEISQKETEGATQSTLLSVTAK
ncbi:MAG: YcbK family protein [Proteobacteria bacterium]|nr:YcbK family protein [Pseudomonadota bacterium]